MSHNTQIDILNKVKSTVENSTRFEPDDINGLSHEEAIQDFEIAVDYDLDANINTHSINGTFSAQYNDEETYSPREAAAQDIGPRLKEARQNLVYSLASPNKAYNAINPGLYLSAHKRYWHLESCSVCYGRGKSSCTTCYGQRDVTCPSCHGTCRTQCDAYGCVGGRVLCFSCSGTGQTARQVSYTNYGSNGPVTEYRTEYVPCTAGCQHGYRQCTSCFGSGYVSCRTCNLSGRVQCSTCRGMGEIDCTTCGATGKVGQVAQTDVSISVGFSLALPADTPDDARGIADKEGCHGLANQAVSLTPVPDGVNTEASGIVRARYAGQLLIGRDDVRCNERDFHVVAYGNEMKWWSLDNILEHLLSADLDALKQANDTAKQEGAFSTNVDPVLQPLRDVIASELNAELVEAALGQKEAGHVNHQAVSADYAGKVRHELLETLRLVHTRSAKAIALAITGFALLTGLGVWWFAGTWWGLLAIMAFAFLGSVVLDQRVRSLLRKTFPSKTMADRAMAIAKQSGRAGQAKWLIRTPPVLLAIAMLVWMPSSPADAPSGDEPAAVTEANPQQETKAEKRKHAKKTEKKKNSGEKSAKVMDPTKTTPEANRPLFGVEEDDAQDTQPVTTADQGMSGKWSVDCPACGYKSTWTFGLGDGNSVRSAEGVIGQWTVKSGYIVMTWNNGKWDKFHWPIENGRAVGVQWQGNRIYMNKNQ